jgi:hypothetical protein
LRKKDWRIIVGEEGLRDLQLGKKECGIRIEGFTVEEEGKGEE